MGPRGWDQRGVPSIPHISHTHFAGCSVAVLRCCGQGRGGITRLKCDATSARYQSSESAFCRCVLDCEKSPGGGSPSGALSSIAGYRGLRLTEVNLSGHPAEGVSTAEPGFAVASTAHSRKLY